MTTDLWPRIEPLLARVEKPARYIGMERGAIRPDHRPRPGRLAPDLPRHLRDRPPQPGAPDPLRDPERTRRRGRPSAPTRRGSTSRRELRRTGVAAVQRRHPPAGRRLRRPRVQPLGRARVHERARTASTSPACRCERRPVARRPARRSPAATARTTPSRSPSTSTPSSSGDGEEVVGEIAEVVGAWKRGRRTTRPRGACCASSPRSPACTCPSMYEVEYDGPVVREIRPRFPDVPAVRRQAHRRRPRRVAVPEAAARARSSKWCTTG